MLKFIVVSVIFFTLIECTLPPNFKKCNRNQPNFDFCIIEAAQFAIGQLTRPYKELNLPTLDPLEIKSLSVKREEGQTLVVDQTFKNCLFSGISKAQFKKYLVDFKKRTTDVELVIPKMTIKCEYEIDGKLLASPVKGEGNSTFIFIANSTYLEYKKHKRTHTKVGKISIDAFPEDVELNFENLFGTNKEFSDSINRGLSENSKEIYQELKGPYNDLMATIMESILNQVFGKLSLEEAFD